MFSLKERSVMNITNDYGSFNNFKKNEDDDIIIIIKYLLLSIPSTVLLLDTITLITYSIPEPLLFNE